MIQLIKRPIKKEKKKHDDQLKVKIYGGRNLLVKEPSYERKIFLLSDIVIDLDAFIHVDQNRKQLFDSLVSWRPALQIKQENKMIHVKLDTSIDGLDTFQAVSLILRSIPNENACRISDQLIVYAQLLKDYCKKENQLIKWSSFFSSKQNSFFTNTNNEQNQMEEKYEKNNTSLSPHFYINPKQDKEEYSLEDYFEGLLEERKIAAFSYVKELHEKNPYLSYMIKIKRRRNKVISQFGYSDELLQLLGYDPNNISRIITQNGPLVFYSHSDKIKRLSSSLTSRIEQMQNNQFFKEDSVYQNQTIFTIDGLKFNCDIKMMKNSFSENPHFFVQQLFIIQVATYSIDQSIIQEIAQMRKYKVNSIEKNMYCGIDYELNSEVFLSKFYPLSNNPFSFSESQQEETEENSEKNLFRNKKID